MRAHRKESVVGEIISEDGHEVKGEQYDRLAQTFGAQDKEGTCDHGQDEQCDDYRQMACRDRYALVCRGRVLDDGARDDARVEDLLVAVDDDRDVELSVIRCEQTVIREDFVVEDIPRCFAYRAGIDTIVVDLGITVDVLEREVYELQIGGALEVSEIYSRDDGLAVDFSGLVSKIRRPVVPDILIVVVPSFVAAVDADVVDVRVILICLESKTARCDVVFGRVRHEDPSVVAVVCAAVQRRQVAA